MLDPCRTIDWLLRSSPKLAKLLAAELDKSTDNVLHIAVYLDEIVPGNPLAPDNQRKMLAIYFSFLELGRHLCNEAFWFPLGVIRTCLAKDIEGNISGLMRNVLRSLERLAATGVTISESGRNVLLLGRFDKFVGDEAALKAIWSSKGASGSQMCFACKNVVATHLSVEDDYLCGPGEPDSNRFDARTNADVWATVDHLQAQAGALSAAAFSRLQQSIGFNYSPAGLLLDVALRDVCRPCDANAFDGMHCTFANGTLGWELHDVLESARSFGLRYPDLQDYVESWVLPAQLEMNAHRLSKCFSEKMQTSSRAAGTFKAQASDIISIYPIVRRFLLHETTNEQRMAIKLELRSFLRLCRYADLYLLAKKGQKKAADELPAAAASYMRARQAAYGDETAKPKHHLQMHVSTQDWRNGYIVDCFTHERKHKVCKKFATDHKNASNMEKYVALRCLHVQQAQLQDIILEESRLLGRSIRVLESLTVSYGLACQTYKEFYKGDVIMQVRIPRMGYKFLAGALLDGVLGAILEELEAVVVDEWSGEWRGTGQKCFVSAQDLDSFIACPHQNGAIVLTTTSID